MAVKAMEATEVTQARASRRERLAIALDAAHWLFLAVFLLAVLGLLLEAPLVPGWTPEKHRYELILYSPAQMVAACAQVAWRAALLTWALPRWAAALRPPGPHRPGRRHAAGDRSGVRLAALVAASALPLVVPWG